MNSSVAGTGTWPSQPPRTTSASGLSDVIRSNYTRETPAMFLQCVAVGISGAVRAVTLGALTRLGSDAAREARGEQVLEDLGFPGLSDIIRRTGGRARGGVARLDCRVCPARGT